MDEREKIERAAKRWEAETYQPFVKGSPERGVRYESLSGIPIKPLYTPADVRASDYEKKLGFPGEYPFTRGVYPTMYRGRLWTMRM
ncbi:MAG: methylmalonyl-CoA mutase, partial [Candidatus Rokubacteria bacterium]|nr:methylmalonyl-CoA mutase [Candidatus Rokubacteria bacterium]